MLMLTATIKNDNGSLHVVISDEVDTLEWFCFDLAEASDTLSKLKELFFLFAQTPFEIDYSYQNTDWYKEIKCGSN